MSDMVRKQIYITRRHNALLKRLARLRKISEAEVIRQALEREERQPIPDSPSEPGAWEKIVQDAQARRLLGISGRPYLWNRDEIYSERESRWIRETPDQDEPECPQS